MVWYLVLIFLWWLLARVWFWLVDHIIQYTLVGKTTITLLHQVQAFGLIASLYCSRLSSGSNNINTPLVVTHVNLFCEHEIKNHTPNIQLVSGQENFSCSYENLKAIDPVDANRIHPLVFYLANIFGCRLWR